MKTKAQPKSQQPGIIWLAPVLVVAGIIGLVWALSGSPDTATSDSNDSGLTVRDGGTNTANQSQTQVGGHLQGAAKVQDLINGRDASDLQQGGAADALTKDANLQ